MKKIYISPEAIVLNGLSSTILENSTLKLDKDKEASSSNPVLSKKSAWTDDEEDFDDNQYDF